jgi:ribosome-associated protein
MQATRNLQNSGLLRSQALSQRQKKRNFTNRKIHHMKKEKLNTLIIKSLEDSKGINIITLEVKKFTTIADHMIICTGTSNRHVAGIVSNLVETIKKAGFPVNRVEGEDTAEWIVADLGDTLVHVMQESVRELYQLESLWSGPNTAGDMPDRGN